MRLRLDMTTCPKGHDMTVLKSEIRQIGTLKAAWRRRACVKCHYHETTIEVPDHIVRDLSLMVDHLGGGLKDPVPKRKTRKTLPAKVTIPPPPESQDELDAIPRSEF